MLMATTADASLIVEVDHQSGSVQYLGSTEVRKNERFQIVVKNTNVDCFYFNQTVVSDSSDPEEAAVADTVRFTIPHDGETDTYRITAALQPGKTETACGLKARSWDISVTTSGWKLGSSGMVTFYDFTNPVYFLAPSTQDLNGMSVDGFIVSEDTAARDDFSAGAAVTAHLFHSRKGSILNTDVYWAPLSFGVAVANNDQANYYLGTSLKFGDKWYLTLGSVFGNKDRLPSGTQLGDFVTDANAIATLGSKNSTAVFFGISVGIGDIDLSPLTKPFSQKVPTPDPGQ